MIKNTSKKRQQYRKAISAAGNYPSAHTGGIRQNIHWKLDTAKPSVVIGALMKSGSTAPRALEHGGYSMVTRTHRRTKGTYTKTERRYIRARPFMKSALKEKLGDVTKIFAKRFRSHFNKGRIPR